MKKVLGIFVFVSLVAFGILSAENLKGRYVGKSFVLPAGSTVTVSILASQIPFEVDGSTVSSYSYEYVIPRNSIEAGYSFNVEISSQVLYLIFHGDLR